ncbi:MAG TPA: hypothetical protein VF251_05925 [Pyrinomonadaceae bacterium]
MQISAHDYRITLKRDADFWQDELEIRDSTDSLVPLLDAELIIHPGDNSPDVIWDVLNSKLSLPSTGVIRFTVLLEEIAAYAWNEGEYCLSITYTNGKRDRSFLTGPVEVKEEC